MKRILWVDEINEIQNQLDEVLQGRYLLITAKSIGEAKKLLKQDLFDFILLETRLTDGDGFDFCAEIRSQVVTHDIPVIFITTASDVQLKVKAFTMGADDYVMKPVHPLELAARIEARVKRSQSRGESQTLLKKGPITLSIAFQKAFLKEESIEKDLKLTPTEFKLLYFFIKNDGEILTRTQLLSTIWSDEVHVLARTIDKHISTLKKKLGHCAESIQSIHNQGYRFSIVQGVAQRPNPTESEINLALT